MSEIKEIITGKVMSRCEAAAMLHLLSKEWAPHILWTLGCNPPMRFGAIRRSLPGNISARVLSVRLKELVDKSIVIRHEIGPNNSRVQYTLSDLGKNLHLDLKNIEKLRI